MDTGGVVKVTSFDESNQTINNAFDKAIADHAEKMKRLEEKIKKDEERKYKHLYMFLILSEFF